MFTVETLLPFGLFLVGLVLIVKGGDAFVDAAVWMAEVSGIPQFVIGATIVSLATTLPEMFVSIFASLQGSVDMAVGNAVGSVTANTALILAIAMIAMPGAAPRSQYLAKSLLLLAAMATLTASSRGTALAIPGSILLIVIMVISIGESLLSSRGDHRSTEKRVPAKGEVPKNLALFVLGAVGIVWGSDMLVDGATAIAAMLHVPEAVIGVTVVAVGTSLPELVTTITAIAKKQASLSAGNVIGANIIDTCLILPICSLVSGQALPIGEQGRALDIPFCLLVTVVALVPTIFSQKFRRVQGVALLALYMMYLALVCF